MTIRSWLRPRDPWLWLGPGWPLLALALVLAAVQVMGTHVAATWQQDRKAVDGVAILLLVAEPLALVGRRRFPGATVWSVCGIALLYMLLGYPYGPVLLSVLVALYAAIVAGRRLAGWLAGGALGGLHFGLALLLGLKPRPSWTQAIIFGACLLLVLVICEALRVRRERLQEAERTQLEEARRRASEERLAMARELHDVLAHHISMMNVQAGVALHLMDRRPEQARIALTAIEAASREAMGELRSVLTILNRPDEPPPRAPAPSLARLDSLVDQAAAAGIAVRTEIAGEPRPLPAPIDAAAFRIVQEALTNVIRHARASAAAVRVGYGPCELTVEVEDNGDGSGQRSGLAGGGNGIPGMRERVHALGGQFEAGRLPGRGFRVRARLPEGGEP